MNGFQQKVVSEKIAKDQNFVNVYMTDITNKRNLRVKAIDVANSILNVPQMDAVGKRSIPELDGKKLVDTASLIYDFMVADGGLETIENPKIIS